jgi:hypothetical protein
LTERIATVCTALLLALPALAQSTYYAPGNLVVAIEGCGVHGGTCTSVLYGTGTGAGNSSIGGYGDNQAAPFTLFQYQPTGTSSATYVNSLVFPQSGAGANFPVSGEYGSSSEATIQLSGLGQYLAIMGYGINAIAFNAAYAPGVTSDLFGSTAGGGTGALAQSGSLTGQSYTAVPRVVALVDANGNVNSSTALYNIFNNNNPRSVFTQDGSTAYVSGQGNKDATGGVFYTALGGVNNSPTAITGLDTTTNTKAQDMRDVQVFNNTLYVSADSKEGSGNNRDFIGTLSGPGGTLPTSVVLGSNSKPSGPTMLNGFGNSGGTGKVTINGNGNGFNNGVEINLSPINFFFANSSTLYVTDGGQPKNDSVSNDPNSSPAGNGGLQKWVKNTSGKWNLVYTLYNGLQNFVTNTNTNSSHTHGTTGLYGLAGSVSGNNVQLYVTDFTIDDLDTTYLYGITDNLTFTTATQAASESFSVLDTAPKDSKFKGVAFAPTIPSGGIEITSTPSGLAFTSSGTDCAPATYTTPQTLVWTPGNSCTLSLASPQTAPMWAPNTQYVLSRWEDGSTSTSRVVTAPSSPAVYNATFTTQYQLTTSAGTGGSVSAGGFYNAGTQATVTATPASGYYFVNFNGTTNSTSNPLQLTMSSPQSITANFAPKITPTITWTPPAPIKFGSALSSIQLNATANVAGTFTYAPPAGTVLLAGANQPLSLTFTPTNLAVYNAATANHTITVTPGATSGPPNLVVTNTLTRVGSNIVVNLTIANAGGTPASNVVLNSVKVATTAGATLPQNLGSIAPGAIVQAIVTVPGTAGVSGAARTLAVAGSYTGGSFSSSARVTLP